LSNSFVQRSGKTARRYGTGTDMVFAGSHFGLGIELMFRITSKGGGDTEPPPASGAGASAEQELAHG
jgi:hypothetical protein